MLIIPAIDLKDGKCVRLYKGEEGTETVFSERPGEVAAKWEAAGAKWIHVVDLDGAFRGEPGNLPAVKDIRASVSCNVQVGGGIRNIETVREYVGLGVDRVIIGTAAFNDAGFLRRACEEFPEKIAVGLDTKNGKIAVKGWKEVIDTDTKEALRDLYEAGVSIVLNTNIDRDGTMEGININAARGIAAMADLDKLDSLGAEGLYGAILGKSLYTGTIDLKEAISRYS
jgi:phosphoribosylformimino-5-aminoimidazole carboxamide ribotide isomerase